MTTTAPVAVQTEATPRWWPWVRALLALPLLVLPGLFFLPPLLGVPRYEVQGGQIVARSIASRTVIPAGTAVEQRPVTLTRRQYGSAVGGYTVGRFRTPSGPVAVYSDGSEGRGALVFSTPTRHTVLTPAEPEALLSAWRSGTAAEFRPARPARVDWAALLLLLPVVSIMAFLFSRPRVRYVKDGDALVVKTALSSTRFPRQGTTATLTSAGLGLRMFGTAVPGYYTGTFASGARPGGRVQAAAGACRPGQALLLTHGGKTLYLTPEDPQALADWFRQA